MWVQDGRIPLRVYLQELVTGGPVWDVGRATGGRVDVDVEVGMVDALVVVRALVAAGAAGAAVASQLQLPQASTAPPLLSVQVCGPQRWDGLVVGAGVGPEVERSWRTMSGLCNE